MSRRNDDELLSAWLDGELNPTQEESLRRRLDEEPELAAGLERLRAASEAARAMFNEDAGELPDFRESREAFIRTTLSGSMDSGATLEGPAPRRRAWWQRSWPQVAAGTLVLISIVAIVQLTDEPEGRAAVFRRAAEAALRPEQFISVEVERSSLLGRRRPMHVLYGPGGQWVVKAERNMRVAGALVGRPDQRSIVIRHSGGIHIGSDGGRVWLWLEGEDTVKVVPLAEPLPLLKYFRGFLDEDPGGDQQTPLLHWGRVRDILEGVAKDRLSYEDTGEDVIGGEKVRRYDVRLDEKLRSRVWVSPKDEAVRRVQFGLLTLTFSQPEETPARNAFDYESCAPEGIRVEYPGQ